MEITHPCRWQYLFIIMGDLFPNSSCIRVDYYRNIEYTTTNAFKEYIIQSKALPTQFTLPMITSTASIQKNKVVQHYMIIIYHIF